MRDLLLFFAGLSVTLGATYLLRRLKGASVPGGKPLNWREMSRDFMALLVMSGFFAVLAVLIVREVPAGNKEALLIMLGVLASSYKDVVGFQWGSSYGSQAKDKPADGK